MNKTKACKIVTLAGIVGFFAGTAFTALNSADSYDIAQKFPEVRTLSEASPNYAAVHPEIKAAKGQYESHKSKTYGWLIFSQIALGTAILAGFPASRED